MRMFELPILTEVVHHGNSPITLLVLGRLLRPNLGPLRAHLPVVLLHAPLHSGLKTLTTHQSVAATDLNTNPIFAKPLGTSNRVVERVRNSKKSEEKRVVKSQKWYGSECGHLVREREIKDL